MATVEYRTENGIGFVTLNRPEQKNALNFDMRMALVETWARVEQDAEARVVLLTGAGNTFSAGHDLKERLTSEQEAIDPGSPKVYSGLRTLTKPVIVAINGPCLAQGAALALLADIRIASQTTIFGWPQVTRGLSSVSGPTMLARMVPWNIAMEYLLTGKVLPLDEALRWGLVNQIVPDDELQRTALELAQKIVANAPLSLKAIKEAALLTADMDQDNAFKVAWLIRQRVYRTEDANEGKLSFAEKRMPIWRGR